MRKHQNRRGFSLVELEVAFIIFMIAMSGLCPLVVMQSKHLKKIENRLRQNSTYYLKPSSDEWARKLGACATVQSSDPGAATPEPILIMDDGDVGFTTAGTDWTATASTDSLLGDFSKVEPGDGTQIASWHFTGLKPGWYQVLATWLPDDTYATDAPYTIKSGSDTLSSKQLNLQVTPSGEAYEGKPWESVDTVQITGDELTVELANSSADIVIADGMRLVRVDNDVRITSVQKAIDSEDVTVHVSVTVQVPP